jgi:hypothetical protein
MEKSRILYYTLMSILIVYIFYPRDLCPKDKLRYNDIELCMKIAVMSPYIRNMELEGYDSTGHYFRWKDEGLLINVNAHKIEVGDSLIKHRQDSRSCKVFLNPC